MARPLDIPLLRTFVSLVEERSVTRQDVIIGSPGYMAPEQWINPTAVDARTDLYALGALTFEALTGKLPFHGPTLADIAQAQSG